MGAWYVFKTKSLISPTTAPLILQICLNFLLQAKKSTSRETPVVPIKPFNENTTLLINLFFLLKFDQSSTPDNLVHDSDYYI